MKLQKIIFQTLIFFLPTQVALHFWPDWALVSGIRVDYLAPTIYFTDLLVFLLLFLWIFQIKVLSIKYLAFSIKIVLIFGVVFVVVNIVGAEIPVLAFYKWIKVLEFLVLGFYVYKNKECLKLFKTPLSLAVIYSSFIAVGQFVLQRTVGGPFYFLGERSFTSLTPGIALFNFFGKSYLRPYGTFGHPNALGGFLLVAVFILLVQKKSILNWVAICFGIIVLFLTFSQNVWFAFFAGVTLLLLRNRKEWGSIKTIIFFSIIILSLIMPLASAVFVGNNSVYLFDLSLRRRFLLSYISGLLVSNNSLFGVGLGNFIPAMSSLIQRQDLTLNETIWWLQPVHNIYLLVLVETGIAGFMFFCYSIFRLVRSVNKFDVAFILILVTGFLDHYWLTLQQNFLLFAILAGFLISKELVQYRHD